jgi:hypothetical protein
MENLRPNHILYVFSLVLFCLLMIIQCLDFKSIKLLLLLYLRAKNIDPSKWYV